MCCWIWFKNIFTSKNRQLDLDTEFESSRVDIHFSDNDNSPT